MKKCAICDVEIMNYLIKEYDFVETCEEHKEKRMCCNTNASRRKLGYSYKKDLQCEYCDKKLNTDEIETISENDFSDTCFEHRKYAKAFQTNIIKEQLKNG